MVEHQFIFSVSEHAIRLDGYLDAVGRVLTTDAELYSLWADRVCSDAEINSRLKGAPYSRRRVDNWSREFDAFVEDQLGTSARSRLGFYLVEMIEWFEWYTNGAACYRLECARLRSDVPVIDQAVYLLELEYMQRVLILFVRSEKPRLS